MYVAHGVCCINIVCQTGGEALFDRGRYLAARINIISEVEMRAALAVAR